MVCSHGGGYQYCRYLVSEAVRSSRKVQMFQTNLLSPLLEIMYPVYEHRNFLQNVGIHLEQTRQRHMRENRNIQI